MIGTIQAHLPLLQDEIRISTYRRAFARGICASDRVLDVGTGTGLLAYMASMHTRELVQGIERNAELGPVLTALASSQPRISFAMGDTKHFDVTQAFTVLVTETIGQLGLEEGIVASTYDLCLRYPTIRKVIPYRLQIYAVPVRTPLPMRWRRDLRAVSRLFGGARDAMYEALVMEMCTDVHLCSHSPMEVAGPPVQLRSYEIGRDAPEPVRFALDFRGHKFDAVHLYFVATLAPGLRLSNRFDAPTTHWANPLIPKPPGAQSLVGEMGHTRDRPNLHWAC